MNDDVSVHASIENRERKGYDIEIGINWSSKGTKNLAETQKFASELDEAIKKAKKLANILKRNFPDVKLKGI